MVALKHQSTLYRYRDPQGAVCCGGRVTITADVGEAQRGAEILLHTYFQDGTEQFLTMSVQNDIARAEIRLPLKPSLCWYYFIIKTVDGQTLYYGAESGEGEFSEQEPRAWQITVYAPDFQTPKKFRESLCYQIFPDRFYCSDQNAFLARAKEMEAGGRQLRVHDTWTEEPYYLPSEDTGYYRPDDYFGGDLNGIREKLPYLASLGVSYLYLNPIFLAFSNHRYNTADYESIDTLLGTSSDFAALCSEAKSHGISVMLDGVFSHTGSDSKYFNRNNLFENAGAYQGTASPYYEWYTFQKFPDEYDCWWDFDTLPNVWELTPSYVEYIAGKNGVLSHWADHGATSWRLDVADELPDEFIRILRRRVKANDPDGVLLGEIWEDCSNKYSGDGRRGYVNGDELDSAMNYPFRDDTIAFLTGAMDANGYNRRMQMLREHYPRPFYEAALNLLSSHDQVRALSALSGAPDRNAISREEQAAWLPTEAQKEIGRKRFVLATAIQMCLPGVPCVYYGDEIGMDGMADPFNRKTMAWDQQDNAIFTPVSALMKTRKENGALKHGLCRMGAITPDVFAVIRYDAADVAVLVINRGLTEQIVTVSGDALLEGPDGNVPVQLAGSYREVLTGEWRQMEDPMRLTIPPLTAILWIRGEK